MYITHICTHARMHTCTYMYCTHAVVTDLLTANQNSCPTVAVEILYKGLLGLVEGGGGTGLALRGRRLHFYRMLQFSCHRYKHHTKG